MPSVVAFDSDDMEMLKKYGPEEYLARLLRTDSKHLFVAFLKKHLGKPGCVISTSELLKLICVNRAINCATGLLEEDTGLSVDLNVVLEDGFTPLQLAARSLSFPLTELFLRHGALLNHDASKDLSTLPLNLALNALCRHEFVSEWTTKESIYKLFFIFCLQDLKEQLDTIKLLASKTRDLDKTFIYHVEGVVQLAALLMVAWDRTLLPLGLKGIENSHIAQHIQRQLIVVSNQEVKARITCDPNNELLELYKNKKINLLAQWEVLKIPTAVYNVLENFRLSELPEFVPRHALPFEIGFELYMHAGLVLTPVDVFTTDINCLLPKLSKEKKDRLNENLEKIMGSGPRMSMPTWTHKNGISANPPSRLFHTYQAPLNFNMTTTPVPVKSQVPCTIQVVEQSLSKFVPSPSICSRLLLIGRKCMK